MNELIKLMEDIYIKEILESENWKITKNTYTSESRQHI